MKMFLVILQSRKYKESLTKIEKKENKFSCAHTNTIIKKKRTVSLMYSEKNNNVLTKLKY